MKKAFLAIALLTTLFLTSCTVETVGTRPGYDTDVAVGVAPGPGYVWVNREYVWRNGAYVVVPGYWAAPPRVGVVWHAGVWYHRGRGWAWRRGYWG